ncbi:MAG: NAD-dependent DNA ligase LigA [Elusimicrobia bacterium]|nr:NAD-dependent DNA ligase LigA [Elusimicrobiota bacterium]
MVRQHERLYYVFDSPEISDAEFDGLMQRLKELENGHPEFITPESPTQRVGGEYVDLFKPVPHASPMLSLDNCYSTEEFMEWHKRTAGLLKEEEFELVAEAKIDGLSCSIEYKNGIFYRASTRGDGRTGEEVSSNVKTIRPVPLVLGIRQPPELFEVRGEVYMEKKDFEAIREEQISSGSDPFANPRNAAAGSLRQKDPNVTAGRKLKFFAHSFGATAGMKEPETHWEYLKTCRDMGFAVPSVKKLCANAEEVISFYNEHSAKKFSLAYEIDGLVVKINSLNARKILGTTAKSPRWAVAFKYPAQQAFTKVNNIRFSVGRTGVITPVAELEPVKCGGVVISNSTLHNFDEIQRLDLKIGDRVVLERAGDVIPKITGVVLKSRTGTEQKVRVPKKCPSCGLKIYKNEEEVAYRCINPSCPAQVRRRLLHFASREAMNIEGMGDAAVEQLVDRKIVSDFSGIYGLKKEDLFKLELFKDRKADNLLEQIEKSKKQPLSKLIYALGIQHVGAKAADTLAGRYKSMKDLMNSGPEELGRIPEIGPVIARSVLDFFRQKEVKILVDTLRNHGVNMIEPERKKGDLKLQNMTFVFTGELTSITRAEARKKAMESGGKESSSVSSKTSFLVSGQNPGSKLEKAKKLGVKIITEEEFLTMLGNS